jgi:hypothetical protein
VCVIHLRLQIFGNWHVEVKELVFERKQYHVSMWIGSSYLVTHAVECFSRACQSSIFFALRKHERTSDQTHLLLFDYYYVLVTSSSQSTHSNMVQDLKFRKQDVQREEKKRSGTEIQKPEESSVKRTIDQEYPRLVVLNLLRRRQLRPREGSGNGWCIYTKS